MTDDLTSASTVSVKGGDASQEVILNLTIVSEEGKLIDSALLRMVAAGGVETRKIRRPSYMWTMTIATAVLAAFCVGGVILLWEWYGTVLVP